MQEHALEYAGFWVRSAATSIDTLLIMMITFPLLIWIYGWEYFTAPPSGLFAGPMDVLLTWVLPAVAAIAFWKYRQATPGKMLLSLRIVDADSGGKPSTRRFVVRYFAYLVSLLPLGLGFVWIAFDKRKQGWHDKLAGTVVVRTRRGPEPVRFGREPPRASPHE